MAPGLVANGSNPATSAESLAALRQVTADYDDGILFYLNGTKVFLESFDPEVTLLEYLRGVGLTGTKLGCAEGGCGACTVIVSQKNPTTNKIYHASVNACLAPLVSVDGKHVITVEALGTSKRPHPAQERIAMMNGSQCGFCTPGIVMSLYALLRNNDDPSELEIEEAFDGNLCRCTGYRPILDAAQTFSTRKGCGGANANGGCCMQNGGPANGGCCMQKENGAEQNGDYVHANGNGTHANGNGLQTEENGTHVNGNGIHSHQNGTAENHTNGNGTHSEKKNSHANGNGKSISENGTHLNGNQTTGRDGKPIISNKVEAKWTAARIKEAEQAKKQNESSNGGSEKVKTTIQRFTPPGFVEYNPETELIFPPTLTKHQLRPLALGNKRKQWYRPVTLQQLLEIKKALPSSKIIGGSSETQIEIKFKAMNYSSSVYVGDIAELRQYQLHEDHLEIGGNVVLTDLEEICKEAIQHYGPIRSQPFRAILKQIRYFAGRQIRNVGTPAGNLATASPISDLNPVFLATNSVIIAKSLEATTEIPLKDFFVGYRTTALPPDAVIASIRIPTTAAKGEYIRAYKQSKRKDDDIAITNAALRVKLDDQFKVQDVTLAYGGMAPTTVAAKEAMSFLRDKVFTDPQTLEGTMNALETDFDLRFGVPGGMATYRKSLAFGFFYRFYQEVLDEVKTHALEVDKDVIPEIERNISHGKKDHDVALKYEKSVLGKATTHISAMRQATGEALYTDDIPPQKNELYGCLVLSSKARAKLINVDPSAALELPGVVDYISHKDLHDPEANKWGAPNRDEIFFAVDEIHTAGQPIGLILADSAKHAEAGSRAVKIEYEDLPAILTIEEAVEKESFHPHFRHIEKGDPEKAFAEADYVFEGTTRMGGQEHFYLETMACVIIPKEGGQEIEAYCGTQNLSETQAYISKVTGVPSNRVHAHVKRIGGGFGGKESRSFQLSSICAVGAYKHQRPVRAMLNRDEDIQTTGQRHPFLSRWKVAVNKDGKFQALDCDIFSNAGWTQDLSGAVTERAMSHCDGCYYIPNAHVRGKVCKTNTVSNTAFRGFGGPQGLFIAETYVEEIADRMGIPAEELRRINMYEPGQETHFNQTLEDWHVPIMYKQVAEESNFKERKKAVEEFNKTSKWKKRGISLIPTKFGISFTALFLNQAGALVHIYHDGSVLVAHGGMEMGQGLHTKMTMIAAEALKVPMEDVYIMETSTTTVANASSTAASASSDLNGYAIWNACDQINERLAPFREKLGPQATMKEIATAAYFNRVNLSANGFYKTPDIGYVWGANTGLLYFYFTQGVATAEVEVDTLTGDWTCLRADIKMDVGRTISPTIDYGQIEGAFVQGQGLFTTEESLWLRSNGSIFTRGPGTYKIPGFRDIPQEFNVSLLKDVEWKNLRTIQRSRGIGEPPLFMGSSVFFAIRDALRAARKQYGVDDVLSLQSPATPERIRVSCVDPIIKRAYVEPQEGEKSFFVAI